MGHVGPEEELHMMRTSWIPVAAVTLFLMYTLSLLAAAHRRRGAWLLPAAASLAFLAFSTVAILQEGPLGFWPEHVRNLWGNQIFMDLLLLGAAGFTLVLPRVRAVGMRPLPWLLLSACLGSIGFLAMMARLLYLEERVGSRAEALARPAALAGHTPAGAGSGTS